MDHNERFIRIEGLTKEFDVGRSFLEKGQKHFIWHLFFYLSGHRNMVRRMYTFVIGCTFVVRQSPVTYSFIIP